MRNKSQARFNLSIPNIVNNIYQRGSLIELFFFTLVIVLYQIYPLSRRQAELNWKF